jgi:glycerol-3-phosphate dehydrogenase
MVREESLDTLATVHFDLLIVGGGINGAGIARDAAMRGLTVALVEQHDFASGTSSRSSRLIHGGVRYLEHGQLHLVFESSQERRVLLRIAPHLVRPLSFLWPVYRGARVNRLMLAAALTAYDALALFRNVGRHKRLSARQALGIEPRLSGGEQQKKGRLLGAAQYWDAATDDARLTLSNAIAAQRAGAVLVNYARVSSLVRDTGRVVGAEVVDVERGTRFLVKAGIVVNAAGPWSDRIEGLAGGGVKRGVHGSKGVHINVPRERVGNHAALTLIAPQDGRVMFVLPSGAFTIIGTTDTFDDVSPDEVRATRGDLTYLLAAANHYFPDAKLTEADVVSAWAGIRPLAAAAGPASNAGSVSRESVISETAPGLVRVTGGKLTTYRAMSGEVVDLVVRLLGKPAGPSRTAGIPLPGGEIHDLAAMIREAEHTVGAADVAERIVHAYGSEWRDVWALAEGDATLGERVVAERPYLLAELRHAVDVEMARTIGDLLIRRTPLAFELRDHGRAVAARIAPVVCGWLGGASDRIPAMLAAFDAEVARTFDIEK